jgi:hypothetical protein
MNQPFHSPTMNRIKTLSLPLISAMFVSAGLPANAQVSLELSSRATYRQNQGNAAMTFTGGSFDINFMDGSVLSVGGCDFIEYYPPAFFIGICSAGTTGFLTSGTIDGATLAFPYLLVTAVNPALAVEPRRAELVKLTAAPASGLPRPSGGFTDRSASLFFNLHAAGSLREYVLTRYDSSRSYDKGQSGKFQEQIVPGVYHYSFPRLGAPNLPASIAATIFPMAEGFAERNNVEQGFKFTDVNGTKYNKSGFVELSYIRPNIIQWNPLPTAIVFPGVDNLFFSIRVISDQENPKSPVVMVDNYSKKLQSIFPAFTTDGDPRVLLASPLVSQFITPPVMAGGTKGVVEVELGRNFQTGGVTYDFSNRKFQLPVVVVNRYSEYQDIIIDKGNSNSDILKDTDGDGFNNLNEWILNSSAVDAESTPIPPKPANVATLYDLDYLDYFLLFGTYRVVRPQYYGFTIDQKLGTKPGVVYTLQRSKDKGKTWKKFVSDANWTVRKVVLAPGVGSVKANSPKRIQIWVESNVLDLTTGEYVAPPGTQNDRYRVKITLAK